MEPSFSFYAVAVCAILLTGISKSGFGGGLGVMSVPMMSLFVAPQTAAAILMPILLMMDVLIVYQYRCSWNRAVVLSMLPGAFVGLALGAATFQWMDAATIKLAIGCGALVLVARFLVGKKTSPDSQRISLLAGSGCGLVSGFASFIAHAGGPPVKGYLLGQNLEKTEFVGTNTVFFFTMNVIKTVAYGSMGAMEPEILGISLLLTPFLFAGVFLGMKMHQLINQDVFVKLVYGFLAITAVKLLSDSVPVLTG